MKPPTKLTGQFKLVSLFIASSAFLLCLSHATLSVWAHPRDCFVSLPPSYGVDSTSIEIAAGDVVAPQFFPDGPWVNASFGCRVSDAGSPPSGLILVFMDASKSTNCSIRISRFQPGTQFTNFIGSIVDATLPAHLEVVACDIMLNCSRFIYDFQPAVKPKIASVFGSNRFCVGRDSVVLVASDGFREYQWNTGAKGNTLTIKNQSKREQIYSVTGVDSTGKRTVSDPFLVIMDSIPTKPTISYSENVLVVSNFSPDLTYEWFKGNMKVGTGQNLFIQDLESEYQVRVSNSTCFNLSSIWIYRPNGIEEEENSVQLTPNPVSQDLTIRFAQHMAVARIEVVTVRGELLFARKVNPLEASLVIDCSALSTGRYFVRMVGSLRYSIRSFVKE